MFCFQCQETARGEGCTRVGVCGKKGEVANLQDLLRFLIKGIAIANIEAREAGQTKKQVNAFIIDGLFSTITNTNFNKQYFLKQILEENQIMQAST